MGLGEQIRKLRKEKIGLRTNWQRKWEFMADIGQKYIVIGESHPGLRLSSGTMSLNLPVQQSHNFNNPVTAMVQYSCYTVI